MYAFRTKVISTRHLEPTDVLLSGDKLAYRVKGGWSPKGAQDRDAPLVEPLRSVIRNVLKEHAGGKWLFMRADGKTIYCKRCGRRERHFGNLEKTIRAIGAVQNLCRSVGQGVWALCRFRSH